MSEKEIIDFYKSLSNHNVPEREPDPVRLNTVIDKIFSSMSTEKNKGRRKRKM